MRNKLKFLNTRTLAYALFWAWNLIFLAFMLLGFAPLFLFELVQATLAANIVPVAYLAYALLLIAIPVACVLLGLTLLRDEPHKLFALGYAVEGPLMLLIAIRFFIVRELTPALTFLFLIAAVGMLTFVWQLLDRKIETRGALLALTRFIGLTLYALVAIYLAVWLLFYAIPFGIALVQALWEFLMRLPEFVHELFSAFTNLSRNLALFSFMVFSMATMLFSATLFVLMPIALPLLVFWQWRQAWRAATRHPGRVPAALSAAATVGVCLGLFLFLNQQPQAHAFALLETPPTSIAQAQTLEQQEGALRAGLLNAYLAPQRYFSSIGEVRHVRELYNNVVGLGDADALQVERLYEWVSAPLLYRPIGEPVPNARGNDGAMFRESAQAAELYAKYFDAEIVDGERDAVLSSLSSTFDLARAQQARQTIEDAEIHLDAQELNIVEHGDWAEFELHEEYQNQTGQRQEVVYYITLPESAAITGLWLGNSDDRAQRFAYRVAPRGAAQQVYRDQVRVNVDPAIVEQIGPRQYRVRAFPIEPRSLSYEPASDYGSRASFVQQGPPVHLWLTWRALAQDGKWTLPYLAEKRNVYWDAKTTRTVNGQPLDAKLETWLPATLDAAQPIRPLTHRFDFANGQTVIAQPLEANALPALPNRQRYAIVLDRSRSMQPHAQAVNAALAQFKTIAQQGNAVDVYLTASPYHGDKPTRVSLDALDPRALTFFGGQNPSELLQQFTALRDGAEYDAVFVLTDGTGYALGKSDATPPNLAMPLWFVHLDGKFPLGYDDATLQQIQASGGGVTANVTEALRRLAVAYAVRHGPLFEGVSGDTNADYVDGYLWYALTATGSRERFAEFTSDETFAPLAARRLILTNLQRERASLTQLNTLDELHAFAKQYSVVSPYSSMLVLVNEFQHKQLDNAEKQGDRFQRETEEVGDTQPQNPFNVTAVPEPHEYLLMALGAGILLWWGYTKRRARAQIARQ